MLRRKTSFFSEIRKNVNDVLSNTGGVCVCVCVCVYATAYELAISEEWEALGWQQTLHLTGSQIAAYLLIAGAHLLNALPENPTDVIVGLISWRRHVTDDGAGGGGATAVAAEGGGASTLAHVQQTTVRRVAPVRTIAAEQNNK